MIQMTTTCWNIAFGIMNAIGFGLPLPDAPLFEPAPGMAFKRRAIRIVGTIRNISESKRLEEERQRSTALLHTIVATAPGLIYAKDLRGRMLLANASVLDLIGQILEQGRRPY